MTGNEQNRMCKVLYVEDDEASRILFENLMETLDFVELHLAGTAEAGVDIANTVLPDFIFLDINLPGMDGIEAVGVLRTNSLLEHTQIIAVSANALSSHISGAKAAGFYRYITKPYLLSEITDIVKQFQTG